MERRIDQWATDMRKPQRTVDVQPQYTPVSVPHPAGAYAPKMDIFDRPRETLVEIELPGIRRDQITIEAVGNRLVISARPAASLRMDNIPLLSERQRGACERSIVLPPGSDSEGIDASLEEGLLRIIARFDYCIARLISDSKTPRSHSAHAHDSAALAPLFARTNAIIKVARQQSSPKALFLN
jgi:HSP20 family protein